MNTSNYNTHGTSKYAYSIAGRAPDWYRGKQYRKLAPKIWFFQEWKKTGDNDFYIYHFQREVLDILDPAVVYQELGDRAILLCWEPPKLFCHRHLVADWLERSLGIKIEEIGK